MRIAFTDAQLADPALKAAAAEIRACVHCGMCNATCPTYRVTGDELDGPRGRIRLIQTMLETGATPGAKAVAHLDRCLSCLGCRTTCPSQVDYQRLIESARMHIAKTYKRPAAEARLYRLAGSILPRAGLVAVLMRLGRWGRPFAQALPDALRRMHAMLPAHRSRVRAPRDGVHRAEGTRRLRVAYLRGCVQRAMAPEIDAAAIRVLQRLGAEVVIAPGSGCCGGLNLHLGQEREGRARARANVEAWSRLQEQGGLDRIVVSASGCGVTVKDYGHILEHTAGASFRAKKLAPLTRDFGELALELGYQGRAPENLRIAWHAPCTLQHGQRLTGVGERLLKGAGFTLVETAEAHLCCGAAGIFSLMQPEMADALRHAKQAALIIGKPDAIASANFGCIDHLRRGEETPKLHLAELLDWAGGGPKPAGLTSTP